MTNQEYCDSIRIGEVVGSGRVLSAMHRKGLIPEYDSYHKYITGEDFLGKCRISWQLLLSEVPERLFHAVSD